METKIITFNYDQLDPGIRDIVKLLHDNGFDTTDSGDGISKSKDGWPENEIIPYPHVFCVDTVNTLINESWRLLKILPKGWKVEASYSPNDNKAILMAFLDNRENEWLK